MPKISRTKLHVALVAIAIFNALLNTAVLMEFMNSATNAGFFALLIAFLAFLTLNPATMVTFSYVIFLLYESHPESIPGKHKDNLMVE